jgi:hypothetical protein
MNMNYRNFFCILVLTACSISFPAMAGQDQGQRPSDYAQPPARPLDADLTLPVGTLITVRTTQLLSSDRNQPHDAFTTVLEQPLVAQGWVVARRGQVVTGQVVTAERAGRVKGVSQLSIEMVELTLVDGSQVPIHTQLMQTSSGTSHGRDAGEIGAATGIGAAVGGAAGGGEGAAIGAAVGAAAGVVGVLTTRGLPTEIPPEAVLTFRLLEPVTIDTQQNAQAFRPVTPQDYGRPTAPRGPAPYAVRPYVPPPPPPPYYYGPYYYPPPYGYYGFYYGFGPRFFVGPRVFIGPRWYR